MIELSNFDSIKIGLASSDMIIEWSKGEIKKPETINYRTLKPEKDGLFCEKIFGPTKDWECHCGKYKRIRFKGMVCDRCGVEVTRSNVRRERMGHIVLAAPVSHIWYFKGIPSKMGNILDMSPKDLEKVLYFAAYVVIDPMETPLTKKQIFTEKEYREAMDKYHGNFKAGMGAEAVKKLLEDIDLDALSAELREELLNTSGQKKIKAIKRLEVVESFKKSGNRPEWMIMDVIPVIPPELRPMVQLDGGRFATSDLNDLYRRVINRNNRLKKLLDLGAPDIIIRNEKRMLQEAVDSLIDNGRRGRPVAGPGNRQLKSLSDMLKGKQGRFRQNLLGKRVDYSGRSVIVVGPDLKIYQCGLPKEMALELFKPFIMKKLVHDEYAHNIKSAKRMVEKVHPKVWDMLEEVIKEHPVLLNRAPTLHRLGIQAFEPVLVEGRAIKLHPLVCSAYNADFDGDQMAVHLPLSVEAQAEARFLMLSANNLLAPKDGKPITVPSQDMILGSYYLTYKAEGMKGENKIFSGPGEALMAYDEGDIHLHAPIKIRVSKEVDGKMVTGTVETTIGRWIFNDAIPQDLGYVDRSDKSDVKAQLQMEVDFLVGKKELGKIIDKCIRIHGTSETAVVLDAIKTLGFSYSTKGAITIGVADMIIPPEKKLHLKETEEYIDTIIKKFRRGLITEEERYNAVIETWKKTTDNITKALAPALGELNPLQMMSKSGARGNISQIRQLCGMRGLMADTTGRTIERPIKASFREGLDVLEFFSSSHGARKGLADTALRTADSGYLTRRLVDVSQEVIVREPDCNTDRYITVSTIVDGDEVIEKLNERLIGRYPAEDIIHPKTGEVIVTTDELITFREADKIAEAGMKNIKIRSVLTCEAEKGVCSKCYGANLATNEKCNIGEAVGIIAAQSIGEPGTQLTMRTFHTGGVAGDDITQGLPRVEELFEARKPKGLAIISDIDGVVSIKDDKRRIVTVTGTDSSDNAIYEYETIGSKLRVSEGEVIKAGTLITEGSVYPQDMLRVKGIMGVQDYLTMEVQKEYRHQGVDINDKHIEVIVRQMLKKVRIEEAKDSDFLPNSLVDYLEFERTNRELEKEGKEPAIGQPTLLGITKASLATDSFLSAASFQETTRVLTDAAIKGKYDPLIGLKENVILGKLIPAGTGMPRYRDVLVEPDMEALRNVMDDNRSADSDGSPEGNGLQGECGVSANSYADDMAKLDELDNSDGLLGFDNTDTDGEELSSSEFVPVDDVDSFRDLLEDGFMEDGIIDSIDSEV